MRASGTKVCVRLWKFVIWSVQTNYSRMLETCRDHKLYKHKHSKAYHPDCRNNWNWVISQFNWEGKQRSRSDHGLENPHHIFHTSFGNADPTVSLPKNTGGCIFLDSCDCDQTWVRHRFGTVCPMAKLLKFLPNIGPLGVCSNKFLRLCMLPCVSNLEVLMYHGLLNSWKNQGASPFDLFWKESMRVLDLTPAEKNIHSLTTIDSLWSRLGEMLNSWFHINPSDASFTHGF